MDGVVMEQLVHCIFLVIWRPYFLKEEQFGGPFKQESGQVEVVSFKSFYVECYQVNF